MPPKKYPTPDWVKYQTTHRLMTPTQRESLRLIREHNAAFIQRSWKKHHQQKKAVAIEKQRRKNILRRCNRKLTTCIQLEKEAKASHYI